MMLNEVGEHRLYCSC